MRTNVSWVVAVLPCGFRMLSRVAVWSALLAVSFIVGVAPAPALNYSSDQSQALDTDNRGKAESTGSGRDASSTTQRACKNAPCHRLTVEESLSLRRPSSVEISPDGNLVAYIVTEPLRERSGYQAALCRLRQFSWFGDGDCGGKPYLNRSMVP